MEGPSNGAGPVEERRYRRLFEQKLVGVFRSEAAADGRIIECNQAFADIFGYDSPAEVRGAPAESFYPEDEDREDAVGRVRRSGDGLKEVARLRRKDGSVAWGLAHARLVEDPEHGEILEGMIFDVTGQVQTREELERAEEKFRGVFEISPVALKVVDPETGTILEANTTFGDVFGYERDQLLGGGLSTEALWESPERWFRIRQRLRGGDEVRDEEVELRRQDGTTFDALYSGAMLRQEDGPLLVCAVQDISHLKEVERELEHEALHDRLTGLPNRALFWDRLEHALERRRRTGEQIAVFFLDLDEFKRINDEHGHGAGDEALRQVAGRLRSVVRDADTLARLGGDEFGVLLENLDDEVEAEEAARRVTERFGPPVTVAGEEALVRISCGIAFAGEASPAEMVTADELVQRADRAMYAAKEEPGSSARLFSAELAAGEPTGRLRREVELKEALETGDVVPFYQPIVDLEDGRIVGAEALARWVHPERGTIRPREFVPLAEETGLIVDLGRQVFRAVCRDISEWDQADLLRPGFRLHLNLSGREIDHPDMGEALEEVFREFGVDPERVAIEVTETVAVESPGALEAVRALGCRVAVDDFGTRYATLERLASLQLDSLKVDQLFVSRIGDSDRHEAVLEASLTLAASLGLRPVAEGVESERQRRGLLERGCRYGQGFLFARAAPAEEFIGRLQERTRLLTQDGA